MKLCIIALTPFFFSQGSAFAPAARHSSKTALHSTVAPVDTRDYWLEEEFDDVDPKDFLYFNPKEYQKTAGQEFDWFSQALADNQGANLKGRQIGDNNAALKRPAYDATPSVPPAAPSLDSFSVYHAQPSKLPHQRQQAEWFSQSSPASISNIGSSMAALSQPAMDAVIAPSAPSAAAPLDSFQVYHAQPIAGIQAFDSKAALNRPAYQATASAAPAAPALESLSAYHPQATAAPRMSRSNTEWFSQSVPETATSTPHNELPRAGGSEWFAQAIMN